MALTKVDGQMIDGPILLSSGSEVMIAAGAITGTDNLHVVDTEAAAASDDLDTISGGSDVRCSCSGPPARRGRTGRSRPSNRYRRQSQTRSMAFSSASRGAGTRG